MAVRAAPNRKPVSIARWVHLLDQFGLGPHAPHLLPEDIRGLADDPYRSLAWALRHAGAYEKSGLAFSEFKWAEFFRKTLKAHPVHDEFDAAVEEALALAKTSVCKELPGYIAR